MARLSTEMHSVFSKDVLQLLFSKNIYTVSDFIGTDTKQLANVMRVPLKVFFFQFIVFCFYFQILGCNRCQKLHNK